MSAVTFALLVLSLVLRMSQGEDLPKAVLCKASFPTGTYAMSSIYAGQGRIYLFGGWTDEPKGFSNAIYLYNVWEDTLSRVGTLPIPTLGSALAQDRQGNLVHFGGIGKSYILNIIATFNPTTTNVSEVGGRLPPKRFPTIGAVQVKTDKALVFGVHDILEANLSSGGVSRVGHITKPSSGLAWDGRDRVLLFDRTQHLTYSISGNKTTNFSSPNETHWFEVYHSIVSTPKSAFIVGNRGEVVGRGDGIFQVDFDTLKFKFWQVEGYPAGPEEDFCGSATTYVPEFHRLYMFGGVVNGVLRKEVWYIDLPPPEEGDGA